MGICLKEKEMEFLEDRDGRRGTWISQTEKTIKFNII